MRPDSRNHSSEALHRARKLRREMSVSEKVLWECLRKERLGLSFKRQVVVGPYTLDFYCPEASLCVEVDGEQYSGRCEQDARRDEWLGGRGVFTIRLPSLDLLEATGGVGSQWLNLIRKTCETIASRKVLPD